MPVCKSISNSEIDYFSQAGEKVIFPEMVTEYFKCQMSRAMRGGNFSDTKIIFKSQGQPGKLTAVVWEQVVPSIDHFDVILGIFHGPGNDLFHGAVRTTCE